MYPVLQIGPLALPTLPLSLLVAGWASLAISARLAPQRGLDGNHLYNAGLTALIGAVIAGRLGHVLLYWPAYRLRPVEIVSTNLRAFVPWAALLGAVLVYLWYVGHYRLRLSDVLDVAAPGLLAGMGIAAAGYFLAGVGLGAPADLFWSIDVYGVRRHPLQLYEAGVYVAGLAATWRLVARDQQRPGRVFWLAVLIAGAVALLLEPLRADSSVLLAGIRTAQLWGLAAVLIAAAKLTRETQPAPGELNGRREGRREL